VKIHVQCKDGTIETLTLRDPLVIEEGEDLNRVLTPDGVEHFFTTTGYYAGARESGSMGQAEAARLLCDASECATCRELLMFYQKCVNAYSNATRLIAGAAGQDLKLVLERAENLRRACTFAVAEFDTHWRIHGWTAD
jgi:hypothetical protein